MGPHLQSSKSSQTRKFELTVQENKLSRENAMKTFATLFPNLKIDESQSNAQIIAQKLSSFCEKFPEFSSDEESASVSGEEWTIEVTSDLVVAKGFALKPVFKASFVTYIPTKKTSSEFRNEPEEALEELSKILKNSGKLRDVEMFDVIEDEDEDEEVEDEDEDFVLTNTKSSLLRALELRLPFSAVLELEKDAKVGRSVLAKKEQKVYIEFNGIDKVSFKFSGRGQKWSEISDYKLRVLLNSSKVTKVRSKAEVSA